MRTVIVGPPPAEIDALIARRRSLGLDRFDEVWKGEYHMNPAPHPHHGGALDELIGVLRPAARRAGLRGLGPFNLGEPADYRVPDYGYVPARPADTFVSTVPVVVEVVSPDDETFEKFAFYAARGVQELVVVDPIERRVRFFALEGAGFTEQARSALLALDAASVTAAVDWP